MKPDAIPDADTDPKTQMLASAIYAPIALPGRLILGRRFR